MPQVLFGLFAFLRIAPDDDQATGLTRKPPGDFLYRSQRLPPVDDGGPAVKVRIHFRARAGASTDLHELLQTMPI